MHACLANCSANVLFCALNLGKCQRIIGELFSEMPATLPFLFLSATANEKLMREIAVERHLKTGRRDRPSFYYTPFALPRNIVFSVETKISMCQVSVVTFE